MKKFALLLVFGPSMAMAQPAPAETPPDQRIRMLELQLARKTAEQQADMSAAISLETQLTSAKQEIAKLTKERDDLKAAAH